MAKKGMIAKERDAWMKQIEFEIARLEAPDDPAVKGLAARLVQTISGYHASHPTLPWSHLRIAIDIAVQALETRHQET